MAVVCFGFGCLTAELSCFTFLLIFTMALRGDSGGAMSGVKATAKGASEKKAKLEKSTAEGVHSLQHGDY